MTRAAALAQQAVLIQDTAYLKARLGAAQSDTERERLRRRLIRTTGLL